MTRHLGTGDAVLREFVNKCVSAGGVPIIRTKYGGRSLDEIHRELRPHVVVVACWGKGKEVKGGTIDGISESLYKLIVTQKGEWKQIVGKV